ncbi:MAG TPA: alpha/beta hydrolase [Euzebyales bacterium]
MTDVDRETATAAAGVSDGHVRVRDDLRLAVRRWAGGMAPTFVLVHGLASNARVWDGVARHLHDAGHRVLAVDQRGHGRSDRPQDGYDFATVTDDLRRLLAAERAHLPVLVGQSWGGNVVLEAAARWDDDVVGVAGIDGGTIDLQRRFPEWEECAAQLAPPAMDGITLAQMARWIRREHPDWPEEGIAGTLANLEETDDGTARARLPRDLHMKILRALWEQRPPRLYPQISVPVQLIPADSGAGSAFTGEKHEHVEAAVRALPRARAHWLAGDHDLHAQQPAAVATILLEAVADGFFDTADRG